MSLTFKPPEVGDKTPAITLPCGQCIGCRLEKSRQWAIRCMHESQLYENNSFITLTYDKENLPQYNSLEKSHFQLFMKRLRKKYEPKKIRFFHCGEYGDENKRPHYHAILFNHDWSDKVIHSINDDTRLYTSDILTNLWGHGICTTGDVTFESAAYVARYVLKKINGEQACEHYMTTNEYTGEIQWIEPEYATMSRGKGIGTEWYNKYKSDVYPRDEVVVNGKKMQPPKFYDSLYEFEDVMKHFELKNRRWDNVDKENNTPERLKVREIVKKSQIKQLKRKQ